MIRFFTEPQDISTTSIKMSAEDSKHIRSLRLRPDEVFVVCDGEGNDFICRLGELCDGSYAEIVEKQKSSGEPSVICKVFVAYSKGDRLDYAVQKSVELGANEIVLFESERCVAVPKDIQKKIDRLQRIALETAKQSGRGRIPRVSSGGHLEEILDESISGSALSILFYECEDRVHLKDVLLQHFSPENRQSNHDIKQISLITGPEGGFEPHEVDLAKSKGINIVSLGARILRSETAPVVALAAVMFHTGNL